MKAITEGMLHIPFKEVSMKRFVLGLLATTLVAGCSSMKVDTDYARQADFSKYKTFAYKDTELSISDTQPLAHERLVNAIRRELEAKGLKEVSSNPDLYVTYYGEDKENIVLDTTHFGYGYGPGWYWHGGMGMGSTTTRVRTYTTGTLVVDLWDAKAEQLVWRGTASDTVSDNEEKNARKIQTVLRKMFEKYPPPSGP